MAIKIVSAKCKILFAIMINMKGARRHFLRHLVDLPRRAGHDSAEQFGPEFLDPARNPEFIEGLTAEGLVSGRTRQYSTTDFIAGMVTGPT